MDNALQQNSLSQVLTQGEGDWRVKEIGVSFI